MSTVGVKGTKASIPRDARRVIEYIKEITGQKHSDEEIYATLKECSMDPDETLQKLFLLDTFHEVKRKRDRRKETQNKEKPSPQSRANRTSRYIHSSRHIPNDVGGGKILPVEESSTVNLPDKVTVNASLSASEDAKRNMSSPEASPFTALSNGPSAVNSQSNNVIVDNHGSMGAGVNRLNAAVNPIPSSPGIIQSEAGSPHAPVQVIANNPVKGRSASARMEFGISNSEQKVQNVLLGAGKIPQLDTLSTAYSGSSSSTPSRHSSNANNRSHANKVGPAKEWKPKPIIPNNDQGATAAPSSEVSLTSTESHSELLTSPVVLTSKEVTLDIQQKFEKLNVAEKPLVIIPDHLHVPEVEKLGFCFGSFDASFGLDMTKQGGPGNAKASIISDSSVSVDEHESVHELQKSDQNVSMTFVDTEAKYTERPKSPSKEPEDLPSCEVDVSSSTTLNYKETTMEIASVTHPNLHGRAPSDDSLGQMPPMSGNQLTPSENLDSQPREVPQLPNLIVPQSLDPSSYYAQFYGAGRDTDSRISPTHILEPAIKYGGSAPLVSMQTSQTLQEGGPPLVLPPTSPAPYVTQAAVGIQGSIPPTHQPFTVFRQPPGVPLPHYNYYPYNPYFSPFYASPSPFHQFLGNGAFPQQPYSGTSAKYSVLQYKQGPNSGASNHVEVPGNYGPYGLSMTNYTSGSATPPVTSTSNEEPQAKENNIYNDGSGAWFATSNRDIPSIQASSFYNLPQSQLPFAPAQQTHGAFQGIFHPAQAVPPGAVYPLLQQSQTMTSSSEMGGPNANVYQQPQHLQFNWPGNY